MDILFMQLFFALVSSLFVLGALSRVLKSRRMIKLAASFLFLLEVGVTVYLVLTKPAALPGNDRNVFGHSFSQFDYEFDETSRIMKVTITFVVGKVVLSVLIPIIASCCDADLEDEEDTTKSRVDGESTIKSNTHCGSSSSYTIPLPSSHKDVLSPSAPSCPNPEQIYPTPFYSNESLPPSYSSAVSSTNILIDSNHGR